jgi:hypothetical protein
LTLDMLSSSALMKKSCARCPLIGAGDHRRRDEGECVQRDKDVFAAEWRGRQCGPHRAEYLGRERLDPSAIDFAHAAAPPIWRRGSRQPFSIQ